MRHLLPAATRLLFIALALLSFPDRAAHARPRAAVMRFLALGDSYTIGEGVPAADRWPAQLAVRLRAADVSLAEPQLIARTGWTTDELAVAIAAEHPKGDCALVTLLIGVNDQYRGRPVEAFRPLFRALLATAIRLAGGHAARVVVVSIPDWGVTAFAAGRDRETIATAIDAYNAVAHEEATKAGAHWADVTAASRRCGAEPRFLAADGLHPSAAAYAEWLATITPQVRAALGATH